MQALKALVITLGILILVAFGLLAYGLATKFKSAPAPAVETAPVAFDETTVALPKGASVVETRLGEGRAVLRLSFAGGGEALLVLELATGRRVGLIRLTEGGK